MPLRRPWVEMPGVWCAGRWIQWVDLGLEWWELGVGWFQDEPGVPVDEAVLDVLRALEFEELGRWCEF